MIFWILVLIFRICWLDKVILGGLLGVWGKRCLGCGCGFWLLFLGIFKGGFFFILSCFFVFFFLIVGLVLNDILLNGLFELLIKLVVGFIKFDGFLSLIFFINGVEFVKFLFKLWNGVEVILLVVDFVIFRNGFVFILCEWSICLEFWILFDWLLWFVVWDVVGFVKGKVLKVFFERGDCLDFCMIKGVVLNGFDKLGEWGGVKFVFFSNLSFFFLLLFDVWFVNFKCFLIFEVW